MKVESKKKFGFWRPVKVAMIKVVCLDLFLGTLLAPVNVLTDLSTLLAWNILTFSLRHICALLAWHIDALLLRCLGTSLHSSFGTLLSWDGSAHLPWYRVTLLPW